MEKTSDKIEFFEIYIYLPAARCLLVEITIFNMQLVDLVESIYLAEQVNESSSMYQMHRRVWFACLLIN